MSFRIAGVEDASIDRMFTKMMLMLRDDQCIEIFESPETPPNWIETIDIQNSEYRFCDDAGQFYVGVISQKVGWFSSGKFELRPSGVPDVKNALSLVDLAVSLEPNKRFPNLEGLRAHLLKLAEGA